MSEIEVIKLIIQGGFAGFAAGLLFLLGYALRHFFRQDEKQDERDQAWMTMFEKVLNGVLAGQQEKFKELADAFKASLDETVAKMQNNTTDGIEQMMTRMNERMTEVTAARTARLDRMHADIKIVPAEVRRVMAEDLTAQTNTLTDAIQEASENHQDIIKEAVSGALRPILAELEEKLNLMPGTEMTRRLLRDEVEKLRQALVEQVAAQTAPVLEKFNEIAEALDKLQPADNLPTEGGEKPSDEIQKDKENVVGTSS